MPDAAVDEYGSAALAHGDHESKMRHELAEALAGLVMGADLKAVHCEWSPEERTHLIRLAEYTARARTAVARDGYTKEIRYLPQVEGPGRLVKAYARMLGALRSIGCTDAETWATLVRIAVDSAPAFRTRIIQELVAREAPAKTSEVARAVEAATPTAARHLEDLSLLRIACRTKGGPADNSPDLWEATEWLRRTWPPTWQSTPYIYPPHPDTEQSSESEGDEARRPTVGLGCALGGNGPEPAECRLCGRDSCAGDCTKPLTPDQCKRMKLPPRLNGSGRAGSASLAGPCSRCQAPGMRLAYGAVRFCVPCARLAASEEAGHA
jgi:hypothetical protein